MATKLYHEYLCAPSFITFESWDHWRSCHRSLQPSVVWIHFIVATGFNFSLISRFSTRPGSTSTYRRMDDSHRVLVPGSYYVSYYYASFVNFSINFPWAPIECWIPWGNSQLNCHVEPVMMTDAIWYHNAVILALALWRHLLSIRVRC